MGVTSTPSHLGLLGLPHCPLQPQLVGRGSKVAGARKGEEEEKKKGELSYFQSRPFLQIRMGALGFRLCHPSEANPLTSSGLFPHLQMKVVARVSGPLPTTLGRCQWAVGPRAPPCLCSWPCGQRPPHHGWFAGARRKLGAGSPGPSPLSRDLGPHLSRSTIPLSQGQIGSPPGSGPLPPLPALKSHESCRTYQGLKRVLLSLSHEAVAVSQ